MRLSVIIPTKNEAAGMGVLVRYLLTHGGDVEVLVVDHGSTDETLAVARAAGARVIESKKAGRAAQMNLGAELAMGEVLYFLHADTIPPKNFASAIRERLAQGCCAGSFCLRFDDPHWSFWWGHFISCLPFTIMRFGDQTLFVERNVFRSIGGFRDDMLVFEDQEIFVRLRVRGCICVVHHEVITSSRKFREVGIMRLHGVYMILVALYALGASQSLLVQIYKRLIKIKESSGTPAIVNPTSLTGASSFSRYAQVAQGATLKLPEAPLDDEQVTGSFGGN